MNVRCPSCTTVFRVDPDKIPLAGIKARCAKCAATFRLTRTGVAEPAAAVAGVGAATSAAPAFAAPPPPPPPAPAPPPAPPVVQAPPPPPAAAPVAPPPPPPVAVPVAPPPPPPPVVQAPPAPPAAEAPAAAPAATAGAKRPSFRNQDPGARAQRIARALVSDIVAYNKARLKEPMDAARMRTEFREEIRKSWEEYVEQVGLDMAKSTPYFRDSLNEILAKGEKVF